MIANQELRTSLDAIAVKLCRPKNAVLFRRGEAASGVFLVYRGAVRLGMDGVEKFLPSRTVGEGGLVGLPATMSGEPYSLTAEVAQEVELGFVPRKAFLRLLRENVALSLQVIALLSEEIHGMRTAFRKAESSDLAGRPVALAADRRAVQRT